MAFYMAVSSIVYIYDNELYNGFKASIQNYFVQFRTNKHQHKYKYKPTMPTLNIVSPITYQAVQTNMSAGRYSNKETL